MFDKVLGKLGYRLMRNDDASVIKIIEYQEKLFELQAEIDDLKDELKEHERFRVAVDVFAGDPTPKDEALYRQRVARIAGFHTDVMRAKLQQMIGKTLNLLEEGKNDRDTDMLLKGTVYALREMLVWGDANVNKQIAFQITNSST